MLSALLAYWIRLCGTRGMPARREVDPLALGARLLPHMAIIDVLDGGTRFRFRLCGTGLAAAAGVDLTGKYVDALNPNQDYAAYIQAVYRRTAETRRPVYSETLYAGLESGSPRRLAKRLLCPLSDDGLACSHILGAQTFVLAPGAHAPSTTYSGTFEPRVDEVL